MNTGLRLFFFRKDNCTFFGRMVYIQTFNLLWQLAFVAFSKLNYCGADPFAANIG